MLASGVSCTRSHFQTSENVKFFRKRAVIQLGMRSFTKLVYFAPLNQRRYDWFDTPYRWYGWVKSFQWRILWVCQLICQRAEPFCQNVCGLNNGTSKKFGYNWLGRQCKIAYWNTVGVRPVRLSGLVERFGWDGIARLVIKFFKHCLSNVSPAWSQDEGFLKKKLRSKLILPWPESTNNGWPRILDPLKLLWSGVK